MIRNAALLLAVLVAACSSSPTEPASSTSWKDDPRAGCPVVVEVLEPRRGQPTTLLVPCGRRP